MLEHKPITLFLNCWTFHDFSLYHTGYSKNIIILESIIQEYSPQIQELKKEISSLNTTTVQELKSKKFSLEKIKSKYLFIPVLKAMMHELQYFKCFEPKTSRVHFWQGTDKCKYGILKYQNKNINKPGRKRKLSL